MDAPHDFVDKKEKVQVSIQDDSSSLVVDAPASEGLLGELRTTAERKLVRKLDIRLLPTVVVIFILNYIDRTAVSAARLKGLEEDLHLTDVQYDTLLAILYVSYCPAQIPSNMIINRITRPSLYIGACVVLWGLTSTLTGVTHNFAGIMACRVFIGLPEAAFYPGTIYLLTRWYTRKELAFRSALLYAGVMISNAFASLMAAGILANMEGKLGVRAWRWLFYIEGAITMAWGLIAMYLLPDFPENTSWFSPEERRLAQVRLAEEAGEADEDAPTESIWTGLVLACKDYKVWLFSLYTCTQLIGLSFLAFFPTLTATLGFNSTVSLLLAAPPWILATIITCFNALHADKTVERFLHNTVPFWGVIVGYIIGVTTISVAGRYIALILMACGYAGSALTLVWVSNTVPRPPAKRAAAIAIVNGIGNIGNLIGSFVWKAEWGPDYHPSMYTGIATMGLSIVLAFGMRTILVRENRKLEAAVVEDEATKHRVEDAARLEGISVKEVLERKRGFRYLY